jgi:hypothetical protein
MIVPQGMRLRPRFGSPTPDRKGEHQGRHLEKFHGTLQADAYAGFNQLYEMAGFDKLRAGRMFGATSTIWNRPTVRQ